MLGAERLPNMFNFLLILIIVAVTVSLIKDGLWSNTITLLNVITSAVVATHYFEPVADLLTGFVPSFVHFWGVVSLALCFTVSFLMLRALTLKLSRYRVRFTPPVDNFGGIAVAAVAGWVLVCFFAFAMHLAPVGRTAFGGSFDPEAKMFYGLAPDRLWLGFAQKLSNGGGWGRNATDEDGNVVSMFDPQGEFLLKYASRRAYLDKKNINFAP